MKEIIFWIEASEKVGFGHLMESLSLAEALKRRKECNITFLINNYTSAIAVLKKEGYRFKILKISDNKEEMNLSLKFIQETNPDVCICDVLDKDNEFYSSLKDRVKLLVVILDDDVHRAVPGDIVINFNIVQNKKFYKELSDNKTLYYLGPKYVMIREELHKEWKKEKEISKNCQVIFINQGGTDPLNLTYKIIKALELLSLKQKIIVVIGQGISDKNRKELESLKGQLKNNYQFEWGITQKRMFEIIAESDIAITAAGNTLYELAVFGIPSIVICHHKRHNLVAQKFAKKGAVINLGIGTNISEYVISESVNYLLQNQKKRILFNNNIKKITDGKGLERISKIIFSNLK